MPKIDKIPPIPTTILESMASAMMHFEGWTSKSRAYRNKNPGNLKYAKQNGAVGKDKDGFAIFETFKAGWDALLTQLRLAFTNKSHVYHNTMTLLEFFTKYTEDNPKTKESEPLVYAEFIAARLGASLNTQLRHLK